MTISVIAAMASNRVIGRGNALPWRASADLRRFKRLTMGATLIMGRRTFESIGRPLPGRTTVVVTRRADFAPAGALAAGSIDEALRLAAGDEVFIAGGAEIYRQALDRADRIYLTLLDGAYEGDAFFPDIDPEVWRLAGTERPAAEEGQPGLRFLTYERRRPRSASP